MTSPDKIIKEVRITEKASALSSNLNKYTFEVFPQFNRIEIAAAIKDFFSVNVAKVNILRKKGKQKRDRRNPKKKGFTASSKLAIVTLKKGEKIELV